MVCKPAFTCPYLSRFAPFPPNHFRPPAPPLSQSVWTVHPLFASVPAKTPADSTFVIAPHSSGFSLECGADVWTLNLSDRNSLSQQLTRELRRVGGRPDCHIIETLAEHDPRRARAIEKTPRPVPIFRLFSSNWRNPVEPRLTLSSACSTTSPCLTPGPICAHAAQLTLGRRPHTSPVDGIFVDRRLVPQTKCWKAWVYLATR